jgi:hypothetical protein
MDCNNCPTYEVRPNKKKLILKSFLSPGDIVMMTAAVRELAVRHGHAYEIDVRTSVDELWENNPWLTEIDDNDPEARVVHLHYDRHPTIGVNTSNEHPQHFIEGYCADLASSLQLHELRPRAFKGDIHLSDEEKGWTNQVKEVFDHDGPFWLVNAGTKADCTTKQWSPAAYQEVVDLLRGKVQFVQVGAAEEGHAHPAIEGAFDLRGKTNHRELIRLVYHSAGVLSGITYVMHLAAAVEHPDGDRLRPCVVLAGGREPPHWEAYPGHRFLHTVGALPCCAGGACWKSRVVKLGDGAEEDQDDKLCEKPITGPDGVFPACMRLIEPQDVVRAIEQYLKYQ